MTLLEAAEEFDRRAMLPEYGERGCATRERVRIMACAQWLRDMAEDDGTRRNEGAYVPQYQQDH